MSVTAHIPVIADSKAHEVGNKIELRVENYGKDCVALRLTHTNRRFSVKRSDLIKALQLTEN